MQEYRMGICPCWSQSRDCSIKEELVVKDLVQVLVAAAKCCIAVKDSLWAAEALSGSRIGLSVLLELIWYQPVKQTSFHKSVLPQSPFFSFCGRELSLPWSQSCHL